MNMSDRVPVTGVLQTILHNCQCYNSAALHWVDEQGAIVETITYYEVNEHTRRTAQGLVDLMHTYTKLPLTTSPRQCVVLCYHPGLQFILTFIACLRAGIIAG